MNPNGLYVHIPFCRKKCGYCDFVSFSEQSENVDPYLAALEKELSNHRNNKFSTMFIGGGTPSLLSSEQFRLLFLQIRSNVDVSQLTESTIEANPESLSLENLRAYKEAGINRLSIGLQATQDPLLKNLGRIHSYERFLEAFHWARTAGFTNVNVDLIYGIPGQTPADWSQTLEEVVRLKPEHLSLYALKVEEGTPFHSSGTKVDDDLQADMYLTASEFLGRNGFEHYEISNFSRPGMACRHNLNYWENGDYKGVGVGAASHLSGRRFKNIKSIPDYIRRIAAGEGVAGETSVLSDEDFYKEKLMLKLRLKEGVPGKFLEKWAFAEVQRFLQNGLAVAENETFRLTPRGWLLSNRLFQYLV